MSPVSMTPRYDSVPECCIDWLSTPTRGGLTPAEEYRLERPTPQLGTPRLLLVAHRDVRGRVVGEEDPQVGSGEERVEEGDSPPIRVLHVREVLPLPPCGPVEGARAPDDPSGPPLRLERHGFVAQEPHAVAVREPLDVLRD